MKIHLVHGLHAEQPGGTVVKLEPYFRDAGYDVVVHNYGYAAAATARFLNPIRARRLAKYISPDDVIVGHSNGCALAWMITSGYDGWLSDVPPTPCTGLVLVNGALDTDVEFHNVKWVHVYHNAGDETVDLSNFMFKHPWGALGKYGYQGEDARVTNIDTGGTAHMPKVWGHSAIFYPPCADSWGKYIETKVTAELQNHEGRVD